MALEQSLKRRAGILIALTAIFAGAILVGAFLAQRRPLQQPPTVTGELPAIENAPTDATTDVDLRIWNHVRLWQPVRDPPPPPPPPPAAKPPLNWQLFAVTQRGDALKAMIDIPGQGLVTAGIDDSISGALVTAIEADAVTLQRGPHTYTLRIGGGK
jgi:hypothetical protein